MLGEVVLIDLDQFPLNLGHLSRVFVCYPGGHALRHPANNEVVIAGFHQTAVENLLNRLLLLDAAVELIQGRLHSRQKFIEGKRGEVQQVHHAHRVGLWLGQQRPQEAAGRNDVVLVGLLLEVFQRVEGGGTFLYLIKNHQSLTGQNFLSGNQGEQFYDPLGVLVDLKNRFQFVFFIEVEVNGVLVAALSELFHQPGLANLTCAFEYHRLAVFAVLPLD